MTKERRDELRDTHQPITHQEVLVLLDAADERDEAVAMLEALPVWGRYPWRDVPRTVSAKLKENAQQIVELMHERDRLQNGQQIGDLVYERDRLQAENERLRDLLGKAETMVMRAFDDGDEGREEHHPDIMTWLARIDAALGPDRDRS